MSLPVTCPSCAHRARVPPDFAGKPVRCPKCKISFTVPSTDGGEVRAAPPSPAMPPEPPIEYAAIQSTEESTTHCPACRETILVGAKKCRHCGERLDKPKRRRREDSEGEALPPLPDEKSMDGACILSMILAVIGLSAAFFGLCCAVGSFASIPVCAVGLISAYYSKGSGRTAALVLNGLVMVPAVVFTVMGVTALMGLTSMSIFSK